MESDRIFRTPFKMRRFAALAFAFFVFHSTAFGWCNSLPRLICAEYSQSKAVVVAKLTRKQHFRPQGKQDYYVYSLAATKILRGNIEGHFRVWEENSSGRAPFGWTVGETYLLFLDPTEDGMWDLYGCGNSAPVGQAGFTLKVIESLGKRSGGVIEGLVTDAYPANKDLSGITIQIRGKDRDYEATTNTWGEFKAHVPQGSYVVVVPPQHGRTFRWDNLDSYEDPKHVLIINGGGAQVVFERR